MCVRLQVFHNSKVAMLRYASHLQILKPSHQVHFEVEFSGIRTLIGHEPN